MTTLTGRTLDPASFRISPEFASSLRSMDMIEALNDSGSNVTMVNKLKWLHNIRRLEVPYTVRGFNDQMGKLRFSGTLIVRFPSTWVLSVDLDTYDPDKYFTLIIHNVLYCPRCPFPIIAKNDLTLCGFLAQTDPGTELQYFEHRRTKQRIPITLQDRLEMIAMSIVPSTSVAYQSISTTTSSFAVTLDDCAPSTSTEDRRLRHQWRLRLRPSLRFFHDSGCWGT